MTAGPAPRLDRRSFLRGAGAAGGAALLATLPARTAAADPALAPFLHGVASGDPLGDRVVIWTRVDPAGGAGDIPTSWVMATDPALTAVVASGNAVATAERDHCVKVDVAGLSPATTYYYGFTALGRTSLTGRTKTAPTGATTHLRFGVVSCSNFPDGFFNAYRRLSERQDLDAVLHLGDYLYESGNSSKVGRPANPPREMVTLADYRTRYGQYRLDPDLRRLHQQYAFITVWDDHESTNDSWRGGAQNHNAGEGNWFERKRISGRVYDEWLPIRLPDQSGRTAEDTIRIYRQLPYGDLADLVLLDTRLEGRDVQLSGDPVFTNDRDAPKRTILGAAQEAWLTARLLESADGSPRWRILGQQVMIAQLNGVGLPDLPEMPFARQSDLALNPDQWDGYAANRRRVYDVLSGAAGGPKINNVVVLTGDIHTSWASDLTTDPYNPAIYNPVTGGGSLAVEFVTPSITSTNFDDATGVPSDGLEAGLKVTNPHIKYAELDSNGYLVLDVTPERVQSDWYHVDTVARPSPNERLAASWLVRDGQNHVKQATVPAEAGPSAEPAPEGPSGPAPVIPEVPVAALLPASAVAIVGAAVALRRRGAAPGPEPTS